MPAGAPQSPDYKGAAEAQGQSGINNINAQTQANRPDVNTPWGQSKWTNNGGQWQNDITLSPEEQHSFDQQEQIKGGRSDLALGLEGQATNAMKNPMDWGSLGSLPNGDAARQEAEDATMRSMHRGMDPMWAQREEQEKSSLANSGLDQNSAAYQTEMSKFGTQRNQAYQGAQDSAIQSGASASQQAWGQQMGNRQQGLSEMLSQRMQPFNEMQAALNGQQVSMPNMPSFMGAGAAGATQYGNAAGQQGDYAMNAYKANNAAWADIAGGAAAGAKGGAMMFSDERLKENIIRSNLEALPGVPWANWTWRKDGRYARGVIAQDLHKVRPDLVHLDSQSGFLMVDYRGLLASRGAL